jgi:hypothetical protein
MCSFYQRLGELEKDSLLVNGERMGYIRYALLKKSLPCLVSDELPEPNRLHLPPDESIHRTHYPTSSSSYFLPARTWYSPTYPKHHTSVLMEHPLGSRTVDDLHFCKSAGPRRLTSGNFASVHPMLVSHFLTSAASGSMTKSQQYISRPTQASATMSSMLRTM